MYTYCIALSCKLFCTISEGAAYLKCIRLLPVYWDVYYIGLMPEMPNPSWYLLVSVHEETISRPQKSWGDKDHKCTWLPGPGDKCERTVGSLNDAVSCQTQWLQTTEAALPVSNVSHQVRRPHTRPIVKKHNVWGCVRVFVNSHIGVWRYWNQVCNPIMSVWVGMCVVSGCPVVLGKRHVSIQSRNLSVGLGEHVDAWPGGKACDWLGGWKEARQRQLGWQCTVLPWHSSTHQFHTHSACCVNVFQLLACVRTDSRGNDFL